MTWLQSRFASVNAAVLFIALLFFGWLWGVWGLLLGRRSWRSVQGHPAIASEALKARGRAAGTIRPPDSAM
jgi:hypothetical protein